MIILSQKSCNQTGSRKFRTQNFDDYFLEIWEKAQYSRSSPCTRSRKGTSPVTTTFMKPCLNNHFWVYTTDLFVCF